MEGRGLLGIKGAGRVRGEHDQVLGQQNKTQVPRIRRKNGNRQPPEVGGRGNLPEIWEIRVPSYSKEGSLDEMPYQGKRGLVESTYSRMIEHQVAGWGCHLIV